MIFLQPYKKYFDFKGRATRKEYWLFTLFFLVCYSAITLSIYMAKDNAIVTTILGGILFVFIFGSLIPSVAVAVRRLHDTNRSGWWYLLSFIPIIGQIWLIVWLCLDSQPGENRFGKNPKGVERLPLEKKALETTALSQKID